MSGSFPYIYYYWVEEYGSLYRGVRYIGFVIPGCSLYRVHYTGVFVVQGSLYRGVRYRGFVIPGCSL